MIEHAGYTWTREASSTTWRTTVGERCHVLTWPFGQIHQVKILIEYAHATSEHTGIGKSVGVGLEPCGTREAAMGKGVAWAEQYLREGPPGPVRVFTDCFEYWKTLFRTRADVIGQLFFTIGGGYTWLDGAIICKSPEDHLAVLEELAELQEVAGKAGIIDALISSERALVVGPILDDSQPRSFRPVHAGGYSNILHVPDDVVDDWLHIAYEAACLLRDRSIESDVQNRKIGTRIATELKERFGKRLVSTHTQRR